MPFHMRWTYWRQQAGLLLSALVAAFLVKFLRGDKGAWVPT